MREKIHQLVTVTICVLFVIAVLVFSLVFRIIIVDGDSMAPTFSDGQIVLAKRNCSDISNGDIVVAQVNISGEPENVVKRVFAMEGDEIRVENEQLYINHLLIEGAHFHETDDSVYNLGKDEVFLLGDNIQNSMDSRFFGAIQKEEIIAVCFAF